MYAVVKVDGKQHKVAEGDVVLVDRMREREGATVALTPLMFRGDETVIDRDSLAKVKVEAVVVAHERGPKVRVFKFKPKSGYKRATGHRSELTRLEISKITFGGKGAGAGAAKKAAAAKPKPKAEATAEPAGESGDDKATGKKKATED